MSESSITHLGHLVRRFLGALSRQAPASMDHEWAVAHMLPAEIELWGQLSAADQRHSIAVARRFSASLGAPCRADLAAGLLHDVGKLRSGLGTFGRVAATLIGPHGPRFRDYHDHERIGAEMLREAHSEPETIALVDGTTGRTEVLAALRHADNV